VNDTKTMYIRLITNFTDNYMEKLFYFCLKKTGKASEAEELTQDIALNVVTALKKGTIPTSFSAWVWQIARNRYALWADEKHKLHQTVSGYDIGDYEISDDSTDIADEMIRSENLTLLRRELAFIRKEYREIIVAYYIKGKKVREISSALNLSSDAVQQRLHRARKILKEGMYMAREFGKRSYNPEQVSFVMNGKDGTMGQPWSIISRLLYMNIFLEAYENPETAEELSLELGVALPYMEDILEYLVREQLLRKSGNKYETDFKIISREEQRAEHDANRKIQKPLTDKLCQLIDAYMSEDGSEVNAEYVGYETAKWALLTKTFDFVKWRCKTPDAHEDYEEYPDRPDDGKWVLTGYELTDWEEPPFVGMHGWLSHDESEVKQDIHFGQCKFYIGNHYSKTPEHLNWNEAYNLWLVASEKAEAAESDYIKKLTEYGYIKKENGIIKPNVVVFKCRGQRSSNEALHKKIDTLISEMGELITNAPMISRGYVIEQAIADGWLKYDGTFNGPEGAFIYI